MATGGPVSFCEFDAHVFETLIFTAFISMVEGGWNLLYVFSHNEVFIV